MLRQILHGGGDPEHVALRHAGGRNDVGHAGLAHGEGPRLVEDDHGEPVGLLEALAPLDEDPLLGADPRSHHDGRRCRQSHGAGAGDDEDGDEVEQGPREDGVRDEEGPDDECDRGDRHDGWHEDGGHAVGDPLDGRLGALGLLDEADDLGKGRLGADLRCPEGKASALVDRGPEYLDPGLLRDGHALAGEHGFIDGGGSCQDDTVRGDLLTGSHEDLIALHDLFDGNIRRLAIPDHARRPGPQAHEALDRLGGLSLRPRLQEPPQYDEADDESRPVIVDVKVDPRVGEGGREERGQRRVEVGRESPHGHQRVHVGGLLFQRLQGPRVKAAAHPEDDGCRQGKEDIEHRLAGDGAEEGEPLLHGPHEDDHAEDDAGDELDGQLPKLLLAGLFDGVLPRGIENAEILVPGLRDGLAQPACACPVGTVGHRPAARGQVHGGLLDTGHVLQGHLDSAHAGRAGHPPDGDGRFLQGSGACLFPGDHFIAQVADLFGHRVGAHRRRVELHDGLFRGEIHGGVLHARQGLQAFLHAPHAGRAGHAGDAEGDFLRQLQTPLS